MSGHRYRDRREAGRVLAAELVRRKTTPAALVLGLPRGGVPVAAEVALALQAPLDILVVRKLGFPGHPEVAMGALAAAGGTMKLVQNPDAITALNNIEHGQKLYREIFAKEQAELDRREREYRAGKTPLAIPGRDVIVVDDGLATGASMRAAVAALLPLEPQRITVAVPVGSREAVRELEQLVDQVVCPWQPPKFRGVSDAYRNFDQTEDTEVRSLLAAGRGPATDGSNVEPGAIINRHKVPGES